MNKKDLIEILKKEKVDSLEVEDYQGNTLIKIKFEDVDIADVEVTTLRLQKNELPQIALLPFHS